MLLNLILNLISEALLALEFPQTHLDLLNASLSVGLFWYAIQVLMQVMKSGVFLQSVRGLGRILIVLHSQSLASFVYITHFSALPMFHLMLEGPL